MTKTMRKKKGHRNERGIALVTAVSVMTIIVILTLAIVGGILIEMRSAERFADRTAAFHWAEGALDQTIVALRAHNYSGIPITPVSNTTNNNETWLSGTYQTTVTPLETNPNIFQISAQGIVDVSGGAAGLQQPEINAIVDLTPSSLFTHALFANSNLTMSGNANTNAYNSDDGPYSGATATNDGDIGTNGISTNVISLSGNATVNGDAGIGPDGVVSTSIRITGNAEVSGDQTAAPSPTTLTPVTVPSDLTNLGNLSIAGNNTVTLPAGTYSYSSISISGNGRLVLSGSATIYVSGTVSISGNGIGTAQNLPPNLTINVAGNHNVSVTGNGNFYGAIYAPESAVSITGNGSIFGAVIGNTINDSGNGSVHFDQALTQASGGSNSGQLKSWSEA